MRCTALLRADFSGRADVDAYIDQMAQQQGFSRDELAKLFKDAERKQNILDAISRPAEQVKPWSEYRPIFLTEARISEGSQFWRENAATLARAQQELRACRRRSSWRSSASKRATAATPAATGCSMRCRRWHSTIRPARDFFRGELTQFLLLAREEGVDPRSLTGSYAGAMGYGQFIPSSFRSYAVDFDGDGKRNIWTNPQDAIGSVANYFRKHGWTADGHVVEPASIIAPQADSVANESLNLLYTVGQLRALGVSVDGLPDAAEAGLYRMDGSNGLEYWVGLHNFYVITRYNHSSMYALAVHQLGQAIAGREAELTMAEAAREPVAPTVVEPVGQ